MPQWVYNILLPLFIAFAIPTINTVAEGGRDEQRLMQVESGIQQLLDNGEAGKTDRRIMSERIARTEERVQGLQKSVDRIAAVLIDKGE